VGVAGAAGVADVAGSAGVAGIVLRSWERADPARSRAYQPTLYP
jgi:hypothetical protein